MKRLLTLGLGAALIGLATVAAVDGSGLVTVPGVPAGPFSRPAAQDAEAQTELGRLLFFDPRLSGDATTSCASCHAPDKAWSDGQALANGYPGTLYFRNAPTVLGASTLPVLYWDGRFAGTDMESLIRDHITEFHFMAADGRLVAERLKQVPEYEDLFSQGFGSEPSFGNMLKAISAFVASLEHGESPYDRFLAGDAAALSAEAKQGLELFNGKAGCAFCHSGPDFTDGKLYNLGVPTNSEIFSEPLRHIVFRRFFRNLGVPDYADLREDVGLAALTKEDGDVGKFRTPPLRDVAATAPYMHGGTLATLEEVVSFYNEGGGDHPNKDSALKPLGLSAEEVSALVAFLNSLSADAGTLESPTVPQYELRPLGDN